MHWSKYNSLFHSQRFGYFLYNALSNVFIELDETHYRILKQIKDKHPLSKFDIEKQFLSLLLENNILIKKSDEEKLLMERQYKRDALSSDSTHLVLSICPTLCCNFRCPYCFEDTQTSTTIMNTQTVDRLISFIKSFKDAKYLSITWYGGEPTIAFNVIRDITRRIKELDVIFKEAGLATNAYLLREDKISQLNALNIKNIQITIDGPEEVHDTRRTLVGGRPTYQRIMDNINILMNSSYEGSCNIRVNLDKNNLSKFFELRTYLLERFKGKNLSVYAGYIDTEQDHKDKNCNLCAEEWVGFTIEQYHHASVAPREGVYPECNVFNICSANTRNSFVVGPEGELYKCWEDVGKQGMVIGSIHEDDPITNSELVALYSVGTDPYLDSECQECRVLPICGGGCANRRLRAKYFNEKGLEFCSLYKDNIVTYLMEYYDSFLTREICSNLLNPGGNIKSEKGYRIVHHGIKNSTSCNLLKSQESTGVLS